MIDVSDISKCEWFNNSESEISKLIPFYDIYKYNYRSEFFNIINHSKSKTYSNNKFFVKNNLLTDDEIKQKLIILKQNTLERNKDKKESIIKSINTKYDRAISNYKNVIKTSTFEIFPNRAQKDIIFKWMKECNKVYNKCIDMYNNNDDNWNLNYMKLKIIVFNKLYNSENLDKEAPYDMLTNEVQLCCSNIKSALTNLKNNNIKYFKMKHKNTDRGQSILIPKKSICENGIFINTLKNMKGFENINTDLIECDSRLIYDKKYKKFYLKCPLYHNKLKVLNRKPIVALDPGEKIFMSYYSLNNCGHIGDNFRERILKYQIKIKQLQRDIKKRKNKKKTKLSNKKKLKTKMQNYYNKIKNIVKELHNKTALYLVRRYDKILIPEFKTQNMVKCFGKKLIKDKVKEIQEKIADKEEQKKEYRKYTKIKQLSKKRKFVLNSMSHYSFRQHLINKGKEYGCEIKIVTEEYTSKCCGRCGMLSDTYDYRMKKCGYCNLTIDRDINGSRNILIKNWKENYKISKKTCISCVKTTVRS